MKTAFIEAVGIQPGGAPGNHGKFMVACFDTEEWERPSEVDRRDLGTGTILLHRTGWGRDHYLVTDLQTGEGAIFRLGGHAKADLDKHAVWVCPLFEPFLEWLYGRFVEWHGDSRTRRPENFIDSLPAIVDIEHPLEFAGYRRKGPLVTKTGKVLTDADIQALADEAERGYDVSHLEAPEQCGNVEPETAGDRSSWVCVRPKGHPGDHMARNMLTTWPNELVESDYDTLDESVIVGTRGDKYHASCMDCDWESEGFDTPALAQVEANGHVCGGGDDDE